MFKNSNILNEIKNSKRRCYYAKFQDLALNAGVKYFMKWTRPQIPISVAYCDVDKGLNYVMEFNIHIHLTSQIKVRRKS